MAQSCSQIAEELYAYEASGSRANTGAGGRQEGAGFERLVRAWWQALHDDLVSRGAEVEHFSSQRRTWARLSSGNRSIILPIAHSVQDDNEDVRWLETSFSADSIFASFAASNPESVSTYPPETGPYAHEKYPQMFSGLTTKFDDTLVLIENGVLKEKILLEYKSAKSTEGRQIDGNAHERLSFQMLQYLEIATRYTRCTFSVFANGAFAKYRNKYHVNFHMQADRMRSFAWFNMEHACTPAEFGRVESRLRSWLVGAP
jgi:hypothetical protein